MRTSYKLFNCRNALGVKRGIRRTAFANIANDRFQLELTRHPALELLSEPGNGFYRVLTLPSGTFSTRNIANIDVAPLGERVEPPTLEELKNPDGAAALLLHRSLPWELLEEPAAAPHSLSSRLPRVSVRFESRENCEPYAQSDRRLAELCNGSRSLDDILRTCRELEEGFCPQVPALADEDLLFDLLRSAGSPSPLALGAEQLLQAFLPSLRYLLRFWFPPQYISRAIESFVLWFRVVHELEPGRLFGNDLFALLHFSVPVLYVLVGADKILDKLEVEPSQKFKYWSAIESLQLGQAIGPEALKAFREIRAEGVMAVRELGMALMHSRPILVD